MKALTKIYVNKPFSIYYGRQNGAEWICYIGPAVIRRMAGDNKYNVMAIIFPFDVIVHCGKDIDKPSFVYFESATYMTRKYLRELVKQGIITKLKK